MGVFALQRPLFLRTPCRSRLSCERALPEPAVFYCALLLLPESQAAGIFPLKIASLAYVKEL